jgi:predicted permease
VFRAGRIDAEIEEELRFHIEARQRENEAAGMSPAEARRDASRRFGGAVQARERSRDADLIVGLDTALQDLRYSLRALRRNPAFTIIAVVTLAVATGAVSTVFSLTNGFFFRPLPVERPQELVRVSATRRRGSIEAPVSWPDYVYMRDRTKTLAGLAADYPTAPLFVAAGNNAREINGSVVSANYFPLLGVKPALGRFFSPEEDAVPDRDRVAVISFALWTQWFGNSATVLGEAVKINGLPFTIIGVAPQRFHGSDVNPSEVYIPTMMLRTGYRWCDNSLAEDCTILSMTGRLAAGRTVDEAKAEMATLIPPRWTHAPEGENSGLVVRSDRGIDPSDTNVLLVKLLLLVVGVLLAVSSANLAGLQLARATGRAREIAIRTSLGAGRLRLARQLMTESVLLALIGGTVGLAVSLAMTDALRRAFYAFDSEGHPLYYDFSLDSTTILAVLAICVATGVAFGIAPALRVIGTGAGASLKTSSQAMSARSRLGHWLVGAQAAMAVALASVSGLLIGSAHTLARGFDFEPSHVALMRLRPRLVRYPPARAQRFQRAAVQRIELVPGVESASMVGTGSVLNGGRARIALPQWPDAQLRSLLCGFIDIGPRYFQTLRTPILRGREFHEHDDREAALVAIITRSLADRLWPRGDAIGNVVLVDGKPRQVVGIVPDVQLQSRAETVTPYVYVPYWQQPDEVDARLCIRVHGNPAAMLPALERAAHTVDPDVPIAEIITLETQLAGEFRPLRVTAVFLSFAAGLTVLLSALGLYGALSFAVSRRTKEIGIRIAIGAQVQGVVAMIVGEGMAVVGAGVAMGLALAVAGSTLVRHLLFGSVAGDAIFYFGAVLLVVLAGLVACWLPARRATAIEPVSALRQD